MIRRTAAKVTQPTPGTELELQKTNLEHDRADAEAERAHTRDMEKLAKTQAYSLASSADTTAAQLRADRIKASRTLDDELNKLYHQKIAEVAIAGIDRARDGAKFIQTAATAIFAVYTGLLALVYSVTTNPLPLRGAWAGLFLGLAVAFATAYLAFLTDIPPQDPSLDNRSMTQRQYSRTAKLTKWIKATVQTRQYATRAAVISLLFGVLFIAAPFVSSVAPTTVSPIPTVPQPPAQIAPGFEAKALELFAAQVEDYRNAVAARAAELSAAEDAAQDRVAEEGRLNQWVSVAAAGAMLVILLGPLVYSLVEKSRRRSRAERRAKDE